MKIITKVVTPLLSLSLLLPPSVFATGNDDIRGQMRQADRAATQALNELQHAGTEFYLDAQKKKPVDPRELMNHSNNGSFKVYAVSPYDRELNARVSFSQSFKITEDGKLRLTIEILKNEAHNMVSYPVRAVKTVTVYGNDANTTNIETSRSIQAALNIAKNQMTLSANRANTLEKFASKALNLFFPSANAGIMSFAKNVIMVTAGIIMVRTGFHFLSEDGKAEISGIQYILGFMIIVMGFKLASTGLDGLTSKPKATK